MRGSLLEKEVKYRVPATSIKGTVRCAEDLFLVYQAFSNKHSIYVDNVLLKKRDAEFAGYTRGYFEIFFN